MIANTKIAVPRNAKNINLSSIFHLLAFFAVIAWAGIQLYFQFSANAVLWAKELPEALNTDLSYVVFWSRILPILVGLNAGFMLLVGRLSWAAVYASIFIVHLVTVLVTDRAQVVKGLAFLAGF